jgi:hypothetical protein
MNIKKQFLLVALAVLVSFPYTSAIPVEAQTQPAGLQYQLLEKIPGTSGLGSDLPGYVSAIYKMALIIVTLSAVLMLTVGGFMYLTSAGNTASIGTAKGIIYDSLIGLVIALSAWLVLYVINPDLVEINLSALAPVAPVGGNPASAPGSIGTLPSGSDSDLAYKILANKNISLNAGGDCSSTSGTVSPQKNLADISQGRKASACSNGCQTKGSAGCTDNAVNLSNKMLSAIVAVGEKNQFTITSISGGPHSTTSAHFRGAAIDISPATQTLMDAFLAAGAYPPNGQSASMCEDKNGKNVGCAPGSGADHIHLVFPN